MLDSEKIQAQVQAIVPQHWNALVAEGNNPNFLVRSIVDILNRDPSIENRVRLDDRRIRDPHVNELTKAIRLVFVATLCICGDQLDATETEPAAVEN